MDRPRQTTGVVLTLAGVQDVAAIVHHAGTPEAAIGVRLGKTLLYLRDRTATRDLHRTWSGFRREAEHLPREVSAAVVAPITGMAEPAVVAEVARRIPMSGELLRLPGARHYALRVRMGRVVFNVLDLGAYSSATAVFGRAADLTEKAFGGRSAAHEAADLAAAAFPSPNASIRVQSRPRRDPTTRHPVVPRAGRGPAVQR